MTLINYTSKIKPGKEKVLQFPYPSKGIDTIHYTTNIPPEFSQ